MTLFFKFIQIYSNLSVDEQQQEFQIFKIHELARVAKSVCVPTFSGRSGGVDVNRRVLNSKVLKFKKYF